MKRSATLAAMLLLGASLPASSADPAWWTTRGVKNSSSPVNRAAVTVGQAKHVVAMALEELQTRLPTADYNALAADVALIVDLTPPTTQAGFDSQRAVLATGQLKALAEPFYTRLRTLNGSWMNLKMHEANIRVLEPGSSNPHTYSPYPWTDATGDDANKAAATLGQLKAVFSLPFETWIHPVAGEAQLPADLIDTDGDGLSDVTEAAMGTSPLLADSDADGYPDGADAFPLDPTRWFALPVVPGDTTKPLVTMRSPASLTYTTGP